MTTSTLTTPGRNRWRDRIFRSNPVTTEAPDVARKLDLSTLEWEPLRLLRGMLRFEPIREWSVRIPRMFARLDWAPRFDVRENGSSLRIVGDVPGIRRDDLEIAITGSRITITGRREPEEQAPDEHVYSDERGFGSFAWSFTLPEYLDAEHATSDLQDGVLRIAVPKKPGELRRKIAIGHSANKS